MIGTYIPEVGEPQKYSTFKACNLKYSSIVIDSDTKEIKLPAENTSRTITIIPLSQATILEPVQTHMVRWLVDAPVIPVVSEENMSHHILDTKEWNRSSDKADTFHSCHFFFIFLTQGDYCVDNL